MFLDFLNTLENLRKGTRMKKEFVTFLAEHSDDIQSLSTDLQRFRNELKEKVRDLQSLVDASHPSVSVGTGARRRAPARFGVGKGELLAVASRASHRPFLDLFGIGVEGAVGVQPHQKVRALTLQAALQLDGIVARVEDEQGRGTPARRAARRALQQVLRLLQRHVVGVLLRTDAPGVHGRHPRISLEGKPGDQPATMGWEAECREGW
jgi:hypothetical protein